jgi:hypothetical protein
MSWKKLDAAIDALVDALAELPAHELEGCSSALSPSASCGSALGFKRRPRSSVTRRGTRFGYRRTQAPLTPRKK